MSAGDNIGASPLLSAAFHDEPTILALNQMGVQVASVGNHEFDEGSAELLRMQNGGCRADDGCYDPAHPFPGASFQYLAANVTVDATGRDAVPADVGQAGRRRQGRVHRDDAEGHPDHRDRVRRGRD